MAFSGKIEEETAFSGYFEKKTIFYGWFDENAFSGCFEEEIKF